MSQHFIRSTLIAAIVGFAPLTVAAQDEIKAAESGDTAEHPASRFKFSYGRYFYSDKNTGQDLNLRLEVDSTRLWIGRYNDNALGIQDRAGFDRSFSLNETVSVQVSAQTATGGFLGGNLQATAGNQLLVIVGIGRTNLKPYYNLNFDPNDAITLGAGWKRPNGSTVSMTIVSDNRLGTGQKIWHLFWRQGDLRNARWTLDVNYKDGTGSDGLVHGWGVTATVDYQRWFLRLAFEQHQNFASFDAMRINAGYRF